MNASVRSNDGSIEAGQPILLDTNCILNAALLPESFSARAVSLAHQRGAYRFIVSAGVMREATKTLESNAPTRAQYNKAEAQIKLLLNNIAAIETPDDEISPPLFPIPKSDWHIFHAAQKHGAMVLTSDAELWARLRESNAPAMLPLALIRQLDGIALSTTLFGVLPTNSSGSIFIRAHPGVWAGTSSGRFTAIHSPGKFWIYYDAQKSCWIAQINGIEEPLRSPVPIIDPTTQTVALSWQATTNGIKMNFRVVGNEHPSCGLMATPLSDESLSSYFVGSHQSAQHCWSGTVYFCISNDRAMGSRAWRKYLKHRDLAPNPYDADRLREALGKP